MDVSSAPSSGRMPGLALSRRGFLAAAFSAAAPGQAATPSEWRKYLDPATEFEVFLLTDPEVESFFPSPPAIAVDRRSRMLVFASRRNGMWQPWAMDLAAGLSRPLGSFAGFVPQSLTLSATGREAILADGGVIRAVLLGNLRSRELAALPPASGLASPLAPAPDGKAVYYTEQSGGRWLLRRLPLPKGAPATVADSPAPILAPTPNPRRAILLWRTAEGAVELASQEGAMRRRMETPPGRVLEAAWSPDGQSVLYLHESDGDRPRCTIREQALDGREDRMVAPTTQFGRFARNANASVFLGASRSPASPFILLLLRVNRRELPLCEHRASDVSMTNPIFTPDSQRILFVSDRLGKPAIFMVNVEKLIEKTDT
jgi:oligogalacturonide lyase